MSIRMGISVGRRDRLLQQVESFFREHLQRTRGASRHTVFSYRDSLQLFFCYLADANGRDVSKLRLDDITEVPVPSDPMTGRPFQYRHEGDTATLTAPPPPGEKPNPNNSLVYEVVLKK